MKISKEIAVFTILPEPLYKKKNGPLGSVTGDALGMKTPVGDWTTIGLVVDQKAGCNGCFNCFVCPSDAIKITSKGKESLLNDLTKNLIAGNITEKDKEKGSHVVIDLEACKGCKLCVTVCKNDANKPGEKVIKVYKKREDDNANLL